MPSDLALTRALGPAEIVNRAVGLSVRHFRTLFLPMLALQAPAVALARVQTLSLQELLIRAGDPARTAQVFGGVLRGALAVLAALVALQLLATAAVAAVVAPTLSPAPPLSPRPRPLRLAWAVLSTTALQLLALAAAPALGALPGVALALRGVAVGSLSTAVAGLVAAFLGGAVVGLFAVLRLMLAPCVAVVEGRTGPGALLRSSRLMRAARGGRLVDRPGLRASLVLLASFALAAAVSGLAGLPRLVAARFQADPALALTAGLPVPLEVVVTVVEALVGAALQPFSLAVVVVFYFDRRARAEGLDLEVWAARREAAG
jgi:hypothetical protein